MLVSIDTDHIIAAQHVGFPMKAPDEFRLPEQAPDKFRVPEPLFDRLTTQTPLADELAKAADTDRVDEPVKESTSESKESDTADTDKVDVVAQPTVEVASPTLVKVAPSELASPDLDDARTNEKDLPIAASPNGKGPGA